MKTEASVSNKGTVLIVDDTPGNLAVLSDMLSAANYRVLVAIDGLSALEQITLLTPDIILLDVKMPGIDGFETCRRLKKNQQTATIPILFMTGLSELDDLLRGFDEGAVDYITKPIRPEEVLARIETQLSQSRNLQRAESTLHQISFAAIAFDADAKITWATASATQVLQQCYPKANPKYNYDINSYLPRTLRKTIFEQLHNTRQSEPPATREIQLNNNYYANLLSCDEVNEYMLLIQQASQEWDLETVKNYFSLTPREAEILMWVSRGKTNKEVGIILQTSPRTVNKHLEHIFKKLQVSTRAAAVAKVLNK